MVVGVGVFVGVDVGVFVGVFVGVAVGLPVVASVMVSVHAATAALGFCCATFGATGVFFVSCWLVIKVIIPKPAVTRVIIIKYQYFFKNFIVCIVLLPHSITKYLCFYCKGCFVRRYGEFFRNIFVLIVL